MADNYTHNRPRRIPDSKTEYKKGVEVGPNYYRLQGIKRAGIISFQDIGELGRDMTSLQENGVINMPGKDLKEVEVKDSLERVYDGVKAAIEYHKEDDRIEVGEVEVSEFDESEIHKKEIELNESQKWQDYDTMDSYEFWSEDLSVAIYMDHMKSEEKNDRIKTHVILDKDQVSATMAQIINKTVVEEYMD